MSTLSTAMVNPDPNYEYAAGEVDLMLADECSQFINDPLGWVMWAFDWGYGELEGFDGPDEWQREQLEEVGRLCRENRFDGVTPTEPQRHSTPVAHENMG